MGVITLGKIFQFVWLLFFFVAFISCKINEPSIKGKTMAIGVERNTNSENVNVELKIKTNNKEQISFIFRNTGESPVFLAYLRSENIQKEKIFDFVPYTLKCIEKGNTNKINYSPNFHFAPPLTTLQANEEFEFVINKPDIVAECVISVMYYSDEEVVKLVNEKKSIFD
jgi:hypothetical protein